MQQPPSDYPQQDASDENRCVIEGTHADDETNQLVDDSLAEADLELLRGRSPTGLVSAGLDDVGNVEQPAPSQVSGHLDIDIDMIITPPARLAADFRQAAPRSGLGLSSSQAVFRQAGPLAPCPSQVAPPVGLVKAGEPAPGLVKASEPAPGLVKAGEPAPSPVKAGDRLIADLRMAYDEVKRFTKPTWSPALGRRYMDLLDTLKNANPGLRRSPNPSTFSHTISATKKSFGRESLLFLPPSEWCRQCKQVETDPAQSRLLWPCAVVENQAGCISCSLYKLDHVGFAGRVRCSHTADHRWSLDRLNEARDATRGEARVTVPNLSVATAPAPNVSSQAGTSVELPPSQAGTSVELPPVSTSRPEPQTDLRPKLEGDSTSAEVKADPDMEPRVDANILSGLGTQEDPFILEPEVNVEEAGAVLNCEELATEIGEFGSLMTYKPLKLRLMAMAGKLREKVTLATIQEVADSLEAEMGFAVVKTDMSEALEKLRALCR